MSRLEQSIREISTMMLIIVGVSIISYLFNADKHDMMQCAILGLTVSIALNQKN